MDKAIERNRFLKQYQPEIEKTWQQRFKFQVIEQSELTEFNLIRRKHNGQIDCIDEREDISGRPRLARKLSGASLGLLTITAINQEKPLNQVIEQSLAKGELFYWHDDDHHHQPGMTGCGANDHLTEITTEFLIRAREMGQKEAQNLASKIIIPPSAQERIDWAKQVSQEKVIKVSSLTGGHQANVLAVNLKAGTTLVHGKSDKRCFVVDPEDKKDQVNLALATVSVLSQPNQPLTVLWVL